MPRRSLTVAAGMCVGLLGLGGLTSASASGEHPAARQHSQHVLLLSVDGLHQSDLTYYIAKHPHSALARLVSDGGEYTRAQTTFRRTRFRE